MLGDEPNIEFLLSVIDRQEEALFKIACGHIDMKELKRVDMRDIAEEALPRELVDRVLSIDRHHEHINEIKSQMAAYKEHKRKLREAIPV